MTLSLMLASASAYAKCDFSGEKEPIKTFAETFKKAEKLILGEPVSPQKDKGVELILRSKTKNWKAFDWKLRPLELYAVMSSQEKFFEQCESKQDLILKTVIDDFQNEKIPNESRKAALHMLLAVLPCLEKHQSSDIQKLSSEYFQKNTEDFLNILIGAESETVRYAPDYKACTEAPVRKFAITDQVVEGIESGMQKEPLQKSLLLRLKRLRASKMHYKTAQYFFGKIDNLLINSTEN